MRDLIVTIGFAVMALWGIRFPHISVMLWAWTALIVHNAYAYGFASRIPFNKIAAGMTVVTLVLSREPKRLPANFTLVLLFLFAIWGVVSTLTTVSIASYVPDFLERLLKIIVFAFLVVLVINSKSRVDSLLYAVYLSLGFHGIVEGAKFVATGGSHFVYGPGSSIIGDNNHFALAMVALLPVAVYLHREAENQTLKWALAGSGALVAASVMGTFSRGGFLGIASVALLAFVRGKRKLRYLALTLPVVVLAITFAPERWSTRMDTIKSADQDNSFMGRVIAWKQSTLIAMENPVFGGGFHAVQDFTVWSSVQRNFKKLDFIPTDEPDQSQAWAAHSIYFEVLGDLGFGGLIIFVLILYSSWRNAKFIVDACATRPGWRWAGDLAGLLQYSLLAYVISGAALSIAYFDYIYIICALLVALRTMVQKGLKAPEQFAL